MFNLRRPDGPPELRESYGFRVSELSSLMAELTPHVPRLCDDWSRIHGGY